MNELERILLLARAHGLAAHACFEFVIVSIGGTVHEVYTVRGLLELLP
jgi:hypothetical protein